MIIYSTLLKFFKFYSTYILFNTNHEYFEYFFLTLVEAVGKLSCCFEDVYGYVFPQELLILFVWQ
jgi:hypothetical protein